MMRLIDFLELADYVKAIEHVEEQTGAIIYPVYNEAMLGFDMQMVDKSGISLEELQQLLSSDYKKIVDFSIHKIETIDDDEQEYNPKEIDDEEEENDDNEMDLGFSKSFLIINLIEYYFLKNDPKKLETYLKAIKIPKLKAYIRDLKQIFSNI